MDFVEQFRHVSLLVVVHDLDPVRAATPVTMRVVQIEPGPMPTFTPSAPASASARAALAVAKLPPTTSMSG